MKVFRTELHGHIIEARQGDLGNDRVLVDGRVISKKLLGGWYGASHFFDIEDEDGKTRHVEIAWVDRSKLGLGKYRMSLLVDGVERGEIEPTPADRKFTACMFCGYLLTGLKVENHEIRCPECGRHSPARLINESGPRKD